MSGSEGRGRIFWAVPENGVIHLVIAATTLAEAEPHGDFLTHADSHFQTWEAWCRLGSAGLLQRGLPAVIAFHEYEHFPRGRIVFHRPDRCFTAYADCRLHGAAMRGRILTAFGLPSERTRLLADALYCTPHCLFGAAL